MIVLSNFGARKNENNFIQFQELIFIYTLICSLATNFIAGIGKYPTSHHGFKDSLYDFQVRCVENETFSIVTHRIRATDRTSKCNADRLNTSRFLFDLAPHLNPISHALTHTKITCPCKTTFTWTWTFTRTFTWTFTWTKIVNVLLLNGFPVYTDMR